MLQTDKNCNLSFIPQPTKISNANCLDETTIIVDTILYLSFYNLVNDLVHLPYLTIKEHVTENNYDRGTCNIKRLWWRIVTMWRLANDPLFLAPYDLSDEDGWEATMVESASVRWRWVFVVEWKVPVGTLALQH